MNPSQSTTPQKVVATEFWKGLQLTAKRATCPRCGARACEVRQARHGRRVETYINHCGGPQRVFLGKSQLSQVMRQLEKDEAESGDSAKALGQREH